MSLKVDSFSTELPDSFKAPEISQDLIGDQLGGILRWIIFSVLCQVVDIFGTVTNVINIICFVKQGFKDSINVSLMGLAVSDLGCVGTLLFSNICINPMFQEAELPFESMDVQYLFTGWPHIIFTRVTSWITAFITLERCLCITMPLKVKTMVTPKRVTVIIFSIFILLISSASPTYFVNRLTWRFSPARNRTIYGLVFTPDRVAVETISYAVNNLFIPFTAFTVVIVCTVALVFNLKSKTKWRTMSTLADHAKSSVHRDQKVTRMVVVLSSLFIVCFLPVCVIFMTILFIPELSISGKYENTVTVVMGIGFFLESTNSAMNMCIYYHMSSKYRAVFSKLFKLPEHSKERSRNTVNTEVKTFSE